MNQDNRNLILAIVCSALLVIGYQIFFELPKQQALEEQALQEQKDLILTAPENNTQSQKEVETSIIENEVVNAPRISIDTPSIEGSISLAGARIDDIVLKNKFGVRATIVRERLNKGYRIWSPHPQSNVIKNRDVDIIRMECSNSF